MGYITNHSFNLNFTLRAVGTPANPNFQILWSRFSSDKEGVQYNSVGLYLQRSYSKTNAPGQSGTTPAAPRIVGSTTPTVETGWTTIKSWTAPETAALPDGTIVRYQDNSSQANPPTANQPLYAYRLIYYAEESGDNYEIDYRPTSATGGVAGAPGSVVWATSMGGSNVDYGQAVCSDSSGNNFVTGVFSGTGSFGPFTLTSSGGYDAFLAKYNSSGACLFAVKIGATAASEVPSGIALDASGNIYICGIFSTGFLVKCNSSGVVQWTHGAVAVSPQTLNIRGIAVDSSARVVVTGDFKTIYPTAMDFGDSHPLTSSAGSTDAFLAQYSTAGVCLWAQNFGNYGDTEIGTAVAVDSSSNIYAAGYNLSGMFINGIVIGNVGPGASGYLAKFDSGGNLISSLLKSIGRNDGNPGYCRINCITLDSSGDVYVAGAWNGKVTWGGAYSVGLAPQQNAFIAKYSGQTFAYIWDKPIISALYANIQSISAASVAGVINLFSTGNIRKSADFGGGITIAPPDSGAVSSDPFVCRNFGSNGATAWAKVFGGTNDNSGNGNGITVDSIGQVIFTGGFNNNANGTAAPWGSGSLTSHGDVDVFLSALRA